MNRRWFEIDTIAVLPRHRNVDQRKVDEIAASIAEIGLLNPPAVRVVSGINPDGELDEDWANCPVLIAGHHRLLALKKLGHQSIECVVHEVDDLRAELIEIDENLARAELGPAQEAAHIARRKEIWERVQAEKQGAEQGAFVQNSDKSMGRPKTGDFARETAEITGDSKSSISQKIARARELGPDIERIAGTSLDKGVEMDALIVLPEPERKNLIERAAAGEKVSARAGKKGPQDNHHDMQELAADAIAVLGLANMPFVLSLLEGSPKKLAAAIRAQLPK